MLKSKSLRFGTFELEALDKAENQFAPGDVLFSALLDEDALHNPEVLDQLVSAFPPNLIREFDLFLILAECMANAVTYNDIKVFGIQARARKNLLLFSLYHDPAISTSVDYALRNAHEGWLPDYENDPPNGLGFPILFRLAYQITISPDHHRLQIWIRLRNRAPQ